MKLIDLTEGINIPDKNRSTPFLDITKFCSLDIMKKMVEIGADLKSKGTNGNTALHVVIGKFLCFIKSNEIWSIGEIGGRCNQNCKLFSIILDIFIVRSVI